MNYNQQLQEAHKAGYYRGLNEQRLPGRPDERPGPTPPYNPYPSPNQSIGYGAGQPTKIRKGQMRTHAPIMSDPLIWPGKPRIPVKGGPFMTYGKAQFRPDPPIEPDPWRIPSMTSDMKAPRPKRWQPGGGLPTVDPRLPRPETRPDVYLSRADQYGEYDIMPPGHRGPGRRKRYNPSHMQAPPITTPGYPVPPPWMDGGPVQS